MTDWYYHDPIEGRVGPLLAESLRSRYRERRIQLDTLVWHHGLREWSALDRHADVLDLHSIVPDTSLPPPLPRAQPPRLSQWSAPYGVGSGHAAAQPKKALSGCLIAVLVAVALAVPMIAILAAIAIPAYQQYLVRSQVASALVQAASVKDAIDDYETASSACPVNGEAGILQPTGYASSTVAAIDTGTLDSGGCRITIRLRGAARLTGKHLWLEREVTPTGVEWICSSDMDQPALPASCRASAG